MVEKKKNKASKEEKEEKKENKPSKEEKEKEKGRPEPEFSDVTPKDDDETIERYVDRIPDIFVDKYKQYLNIHKEDDELTRRFPDDFDRSVRVLPMEKNGKRSLEMVSTDEKKTQDFHRFLKEGKFKFENEDIEGLGRERILPIIRRRIKERLEESTTRP